MLGPKQNPPVLPHRLRLPVFYDAIGANLRNRFLSVVTVVMIFAIVGFLALSLVFRDSRRLRGSSTKVAYSDAFFVPTEERLGKSFETQPLVRLYNNKDFGVRNGAAVASVREFVADFNGQAVRCTEDGYRQRDYHSFMQRFCDAQLFNETEEVNNLGLAQYISMGMNGLAGTFLIDWRGDGNDGGDTSSASVRAQAELNTLFAQASFGDSVAIGENFTVAALGVGANSAYTGDIHVACGDMGFDPSITYSRGWWFPGGVSPKLCEVEPSVISMVDGLAQSNIRITASNSAFQQVSLVAEGSQVFVRDVTSRLATLELTTDVASLQLEQPFAPVVESEQVAPRVIVRDAGGQPLQGKRVYARLVARDGAPSTGTPLVLAKGRVVQVLSKSFFGFLSEPTGADGVAQWSNLVPDTANAHGNYTVLFVADGVRSPLYTLPVLSSVRSILPPVSTSTLVVGRDQLLTFRLLDGEGSAVFGKALVPAIPTTPPGCDFVWKWDTTADSTEAVPISDTSGFLVARFTIGSGTGMCNFTLSVAVDGVAANLTLFFDGSQPAENACSLSIIQPLPDSIAGGLNVTATTVAQLLDPTGAPIVNDTVAVLFLTNQQSAFVPLLSDADGLIGVSVNALDLIGDVGSLFYQYVGIDTDCVTVVSRVAFRHVIDSIRVVSTTSDADARTLSVVAEALDVNGNLVDLSEITRLSIFPASFPASYTCQARSKPSDNDVEELALPGPDLSDPYPELYSFTVTYESSTRVRVDVQVLSGASGSYKFFPYFAAISGPLVTLELPSKLAQLQVIQAPSAGALGTAYGVPLPTQPILRALDSNGQPLEGVRVTTLLLDDRVVGSAPRNGSQGSTLSAFTSSEVFCSPASDASGDITFTSFSVWASRDPLDEVCFQESVVVVTPESTLREALTATVEYIGPRQCAPLGGKAFDTPPTATLQQQMGTVAVPGVEVSVPPVVVSDSLQWYATVSARSIGADADDQVSFPMLPDLFVVAGNTLVFRDLRFPSTTPEGTYNVTALLDGMEPVSLELGRVRVTRAPEIITFVSGQDGVFTNDTNVFVGQTFSVCVRAHLSDGDEESATGVNGFQVLASIASSPMQSLAVLDNTLATTKKQPCVFGEEAADGIAIFQLRFSSGISGTYTLGFDSTSAAQQIEVGVSPNVTVVNDIASVSIVTQPRGVASSLYYKNRVYATVNAQRAIDSLVQPRIRVLGSSGAPISGVDVRVIAVNDDRDDDETISLEGRGDASLIWTTVRTDANGEVQFEDLHFDSAGIATYRLVFVAAGIASDLSDKLRLYNLDGADTSLLSESRLELIVGIALLAAVPFLFMNTTFTTARLLLWVAGGVGVVLCIVVVSLIFAQWAEPNAADTIFGDGFLAMVHISTVIIVLLPLVFVVPVVYWFTLNRTDKYYDTQRMQDYLDHVGLLLSPMEPVHQLRDYVDRNAVRDYKAYGKVRGAFMRIWDAMRTAISDIYLKITQSPDNPHSPLETSQSFRYSQRILTALSVSALILFYSLLGALVLTFFIVYQVDRAENKITTYQTEIMRYAQRVLSPNSPALRQSVRLVDNSLTTIQFVNISLPFFGMDEQQQAAANSVFSVMIRGIEYLGTRSLNAPAAVNAVATKAGAKGISLLNEFRTDLVISASIALVFAVAICVALWYLYLRSYKRLILDMRYGKYGEVDRNSYKITYSTSLIGITVSLTLVGFFLTWFFLWLLLFVLIFTPLLDLAWSKGKGIIVGLISLNLIWAVVNFAFKAIFIDGFNMRNRRVVSAYDLVQSFLSVATGLLKSVFRIAMGLGTLFVFFLIPSVPAVGLPALRSFDPGYSAFMATVLSDAMWLNPTFNVACWCFLERRRKRRADKAKRGRRNDGDDDDGIPMTAMSRDSVVRLRVRNKFWQAYVLAKSPQVRLWRAETMDRTRRLLRQKAAAGDPDTVIMGPLVDPPDMHPGRQERPQPPPRDDMLFREEYDG